MLFLKTFVEVFFFFFLMQSKNKTKETVSCGVGHYLKVRLFVALTCDELFSEHTFLRYGIYCQIFFILV